MAFIIIRVVRPYKAIILAKSYEDEALSAAKWTHTQEAWSEFSPLMGRVNWDEVSPKFHVVVVHGLFCLTVCVFSASFAC